MLYFCFLFPILIAFGDFDWYVHSVFLWGTLGKLQLVWYIAGPDANDARTLGLPPVPNYVQAATPFPGDRPSGRR